MIYIIVFDESLRILVFVCGPLLLTLVAIVVLLIRGSRRTAILPGFSVSISNVGRYEAYVSYRDESRQMEFDAQIERGRNFFIPRIRVRVPNHISGPELGTLIPNLAHGLSRLHFEYIIYRRGEPQMIADEEREAAITELRRMGVEIQSTPSQSTIQQAMVGDWRRAVGRHGNSAMPRLLQLMNTARGIRENIQVLADSDDK